VKKGIVLATTTKVATLLNAPAGAEKKASNNCVPSLQHNVTSCSPINSLYFLVNEYRSPSFGNRSFHTVATASAHRNNAA
jgi:hypothetical protein